MIIKFPRKFQAGGSMSAKTEYVPINMTWDGPTKDVKPAADFQVAREDLSLDDKYEDYKLEGLSSDKHSLYTEIESVKDRMKSGINETYTREAYENDAKLLHRLITVDLSDQSQKESRFKDVRDAATPAKADLAINNGQAFVMDVVTGKYDIVTVDKLLTQRASDKDGKKVSRYIPQSVGTALEAREGMEDFTGRQGGKGQKLEEILHSIQSTKDLHTQLKSSFSTVGSSGNKETNMETIGGAPVNELYNMVAATLGVDKDPTTGKSILAITSDSVKTNRSQLMNAYNLLRSSVAASGLGETLKRNAYVAYMSEYGDKAEAPDYQSFVTEHVDAQLNNAMLAYLKENHADSLGIKSVGSDGKSDKAGSSKEDYHFTPMNEALDMPANMEELTPAIENSKDGLKGSTAFRATRYKDPQLFTDTGYDLAIKNNLSRTINNNTTMQRFAADTQLEGNLFLLNHNNTQVEELAGGEGLSQAALYPGKSPRIWHHMPVVWNAPKSKWEIPWKLLLDGKDRDTSTHAKAVKRAEDMARKSTGEENPPMDVVEQYLARIYSELKVDPKVGDYGDIKIRKVMEYDLMIPIDPKTIAGYKSETEGYRSSVTESNKIKDKGIIAVYESLVKPPREGGIEIDYDNNDLYKISAFSVMVTAPSLRNLGDQHYKSNKIDNEKALSYAKEIQDQNRNYIGN